MKLKRMNDSKAFQIFFTALLFFAVTMPCRELFRVTEITEIRPASAIPPVFGLLFGAYGALGCALGNLAADLLSGYTVSMCLLGFIAQFLYGYLPYLIWFGKGGRTGEKSLNLNNVRNVLKYIVTVSLDSLFMAAVLGLIMQQLQMGRLFSEATLLLFFNNLVFTLVLGIPMLVGFKMAGERGRRTVLTLNVRFVLIFLLFSVLSSILTGISAYGELSGFLPDPVTLWNRVYSYVAVQFFVLCGCGICILIYLENKITIPIEKLTEIAGSYVGTKEKEQVLNTGAMMLKCKELEDIHGEPGFLAAAFHEMLEDVEHYINGLTLITVEKERIRTELKLASKMQMDMLPDSTDELKEREEFCIYASMTPAKEMGGDFYDFFLLDENHLALLIADVSGKGIPAALFMVVAKTLIESSIAKEHSPELAFEEVNNLLCRNNKNGMFVTAWMGVLTLSSGRLTFVNAGHCRPLLKQAEGTFRYVGQHSGFVLGGLSGIQYQKKEIVLKPGDTLLLYTDGVTEANNERQDLYGEERLKDYLNRQNKSDPRELAEAVWEDLNTFKGSADQFDDITMLAIKYSGSSYLKNTGTAEMRRINEVIEFLERSLNDGGFSKENSAKILVAADEVFSNICYYSGATQVTVGCKIDENTAEIIFEDNGIKFDPLLAPDPEITKRIKERKEGGLGIYIVKKSMDDIFYIYEENKNMLLLKKRNGTTGGRVK